MDETKQAPICTPEHNSNTDRSPPLPAMSSAPASGMEEMKKPPSCTINAVPPETGDVTHKEKKQHQFMDTEVSVKPTGGGGMEVRMSPNCNDTTVSIISPRGNTEVTKVSKCNDSRFSVLSPTGHGATEVEFTQKMRYMDRTVSVLSQVGQFSWEQVTSHLGLFVLLMTYTFTGGGVMYSIERYFSDTANCTSLGSTEDFHEHFANKSVGQVENNMTVQDMRKLLLEYDAEKEQHKKCTQSPDYWDWVLFCLTVYTTIGYGTVHPKSRPGRIATMFYATIGIPLFLLSMGKFGKLFTRGVKYLWSRIRKLYYLRQLECLRKNQLMQKLRGKKSEPATVHVAVRTTRRQMSRQTSRPAAGLQRQDTTDNTSYVSFDIDDEFNLHPFIAIAITLVYILLGAWMYVQWEENWKYYDAFYFIFISISTIGFGDVVPQHPKFFILSSIYILFGLALVAMVITVLSEFFTKTIQVVAETLPEILHSDEDDASGKDVRAGLEHLAVNFKPRIEENVTSTADV